MNNTYLVCPKIYHFSWKESLIGFLSLLLWLFCYWFYVPCSFFVLRKKLVKKQGMKDSRKIWAFISETLPHARLQIIKVVWLKSLHEEMKFFKFLIMYVYKLLIHTRIYGHLRWPFFSPFGYGKLLELVNICNSLNNSEGMTIFGRNDNNPEGMTIIWKEWQ